MYIFFYTFAADLETTVRTYYKVAEHIFAIETQNSALQSLMANYEPFEVHCTPATESGAIFAVKIAQNGLLSDSERMVYQHVFTDQSEEDMPRIEVYKKGYSISEGQEEQQGEWLMRVSMIAKSPICCEIVCSADFTKGMLHIAHDCHNMRFCIDNALMLLYAFRTAPLMTLEMHAAVVVRGDRAPQNATSVFGDPAEAMGREGDEARAYLFLGHSGTGKSTHARQWLQAFPDAWLLNDDNPILRVMENGEVRVYGSPWSGKTPCYKNAHARVGGIIKLSQAPHNRIQSLSLPQAYAYILSSASGLKIDKQMADHLYESIKHIITHVQCYHLDCLPNTHAAEVCYERVKTGR